MLSLPPLPRLVEALATEVELLVVVAAGEDAAVELGPDAAAVPADEVLAVVD